MKPLFYTTFALVAFAFNSILCRLALRGDEADAAGFTALRLAAGAVALVAISWSLNRGRNLTGSEGVLDVSSAHAKNTLPTGRVSALGSWLSSLFLFAYAVCFSFAYLNLTAATGALILFGSVQMSMIALAIGKGERPTMFEWCGLVVAVAGLVYLVLPGLEAPPLTSSLLMAAAGMAWAIYSHRGKGTTDAIADTTGNFVRTLPFAAILAVVFIPNLNLTPRGFILAIISGAVTSGVGYVFWYAALKYHSSTRAAVLQLSVPVIAAVIAIVWLGESMTTTLVVASALILGGIGLTIAGKKAEARTE
ncbi:MAG TPA: DMT family transporter [Pyrinomonadaceae bacterium]|mgnify:CR=1 FL=1|nr:DMT family transporter [Pyrinomonadaceae bacterium]